MPAIVGNSKKATSGINILSTPIQEKAGIIDSKKFLIDDAMKNRKNLNDTMLVSTLADDSSSL